MSTTTSTAASTLPPGQDMGFRRALGQFATGVAVVTIRADGKPQGMTINSFSSLSLEPALVLWSIRRASRAAPAFTRATHFGINVLSARQTELARRFATAQSTDPFDRVAWSAAASGVPRLADAIAWFDCSLTSVLDGGDHHLLVGQVHDYGHSDGPPLVFAQGQYATTLPAPLAA